MPVELAFEGLLAKRADIIGVCFLCQRFVSDDRHGFGRSRRRHKCHCSAAGISGARHRIVRRDRLQGLGAGGIGQVNGKMRIRFEIIRKRECSRAAVARSADAVGRR
ncbi:hypothetical protein [Hoeflea sp. TYP-13]|uniref:hypothetical protein n=1 Tax=Hoeflea sp. TYP-13 TaxID=3230023 RepID=UPI0034C60016